MPDAPFAIENLGLIWSRSTGANYNAVQRVYPAFLSDQQKAKVERIRQARMLYNGRHREYFLGEFRSQFDFPASRVGDWAIQPYLASNAIKLVCNKTADLLFGAEPEITCDDETQEQYLSALRERSGLDRLFYSACLGATYEEEAFIEACVGPDGQVYLAKLPADETFCIGEMGPDLQFPQYDRYQVKNVGTKEKPVNLLLVISYKVGTIDRTLWQLDDKGNKLGGPAAKPLDLKAWVAPAIGAEPAAGTPVPEAVTRTGIDRNTVTWIPCELCEGRPLGRIDGLIDLQDALNAKETQIARVLAKHADPKLAVDRSMADPKGNVRSDADVFFVDDMGRAPQYIVWQAQLEMAMKSSSVVLNRLLILAEISPSLLGLKEGAAPDAARKLRLEATNTLSMVSRIGAYWKPGVKRCVAVAQDLENTLKGVRYNRLAITVEMQDGLPEDTLDLAQEVSLWRAAGSMSLEDAVSLRVKDKEERDAEVKRVQDEEAAKAAAMTPSVLIGEGANSGGSEQGANDKAQAATEGGYVS